MNICTIIAKNYAPHARVLAESFSRVHPDGACSVLVVDEHEGCLDPAAEPFELIGLDQIGLPDAERMAAAYDVTELSTAVKPWLLRHLLAREGVEAISYLDPDILVTDSLLEIDELAAAHGTVLTAHFTAPLPRDGRKPSEEDILIAGTYNLGFIALADHPATAELLDWWSQRLERHCVVDPANGLFVDQRWIDLVPGLWPDLHVLRDPGFNVAYWNLPTRQLETDGAGYRVDGRPLRFFHFSGFDPTRPGALSKHQNRIEVADLPALSRICQEYAGALFAHGFEQARTWSYGWEALPNGVRLDHAVRDVYREASAGGAVNGVFSPRGAERFVDYLNQVPKGGGVTRYARALRDSREDLRQAFPDVEGQDAAAFERWLVESAPTLGISSLLLPSDGEPAAPPAADTSPAADSRHRHGVNLAGYLSSELGVGQAAREVAAALAARELPAATIDIPVEEAELDSALAGLGAERFPFDVNLICANADMLPVIAAAAPPALFEGRRSAGLWFWEVERFPARWRDSFAHLDEVWTASEFVAEALRSDAPVPVRTIRIPVTPEQPGSTERSALSMPEGFCFLFVFDYRSVFRRKNPLGVVEAFSRAFPPGSGATLMLKSVAADACPEQAAELAAAAARHPDVHLFDGVVSAATKNAMIASSDCYVSLHRSEGLGLTMAEAMYFGKPVIATAYSGNLDFMSAENSFLVDFELEPIGPGAEPYPEAARWAEPSLEHAAELMRTVFEDRGRAAAVGARAAEGIRASHSPEAAGRVLEQRLDAIRGERASPAPEPPPTAPREAPLPVAAAGAAPPAIGDLASARGRLQHLLRFEQPPVREGAGPLRRALKRSYMRLLRPFSAHQRRIDLSLRDAVIELGAELSAAERRLAAADAAAAEELGGALASFDRRLQSLDADVRGAYVAQAEVQEAQAEVQEAQAEVQEAEAKARRRQSASVEELRARLDRFAAETESALGGLREGAEEAGRLARAGAAKPYMADQRFAAREHPALGSVLGFEPRAVNGSPGGYRGFEDLFRGPEQMIRERQRVYLPLLAPGPVLDAGCGRGEFLDLLEEAGVEGYGVDLDPGMVARCREKGHAVERGDLLETLAAADPGSLGTIFCAQVVEHLEPEQLQRFLALSAERLRAGGKLIVETVNPHCASALKAFWVDPTHQRPLFPEAMLALCQLAGFAAADAFCPLGEREWEADRLAEGEYAILATAPGANGG